MKVSVKARPSMGAFRPLSTGAVPTWQSVAVTFCDDDVARLEVIFKFDAHAVTYTAHAY